MDTDVRKLNSCYVRGKKLYTRASQGDEKCFPVITNNYSHEKQRKTETSLRHPSRQETKSTSNQPKTTFRLPRINVKRESFSVCKRWYSHDNLCTSTSNSFDNKASLDSFAAKKINFHDTVKLSAVGANLSSSQRLLQSLRIVDLNINENKPRFQRENSLRICPMELFPRCTRKPKNSTVTCTLSRPELQATYPILQLSPTDKNAIFALSPSLSLSVESLDSILGGSLTLTQPPPDILSSCSPSEIEFTPPSTP